MRLVKNLKHCAYLLILGLLWAVPASAGNISVEYDSQQDRIKIQASNASLTNVLAQIAKQTGMAIQIDPAVEKKVSFQLRPQSLQQALQKICKDLSYVIEYGTDKQRGTIISGMRLLPKGTQDSGQLVSVDVLNARASHHDDQAGDNHDQPVIHRDRHGSDSRRPGLDPEKRQPPRKLRSDMSPDELAAHSMSKKNIQKQRKRIFKKNNNPPAIQNIDNSGPQDADDASH